MSARIQDFKQQALIECNSLLARICQQGQWQRFEDIDVNDQSFYDIYNQEAWDIYVFSNCGLEDQQRKFSRCQMSEREDFNNASEEDNLFNSARELFHQILDIKRQYNSLLRQEYSMPQSSQERIENNVY